MKTEHLTISIKEARKILGEEYEQFKDSEIEELIIHLEAYAQLALKVASEQVKADYSKRVNK